MAVASCLIDENNTPTIRWVDRNKCSLMSIEAALLLTAFVLLIIGGITTYISSSGGSWFGMSGEELVRISDIILKTGIGVGAGLVIFESGIGALHYHQSAKRLQEVLDKFDQGGLTSSQRLAGEEHI